MRPLLILFVLLALQLPQGLLAKEKAKHTSADPQIPEILDFEERKAEIYRFEVTPFFGDYVGDVLRHSIFTGIVLDVRLAPQLSIGADFGWSPFSVDSSSSFGAQVENRNLYSIQGFFTLNIPAAYLSKKKVVETDFFTTIGGGTLIIDDAVHGAGFIGGGMKLYFGKLKHVGFRVEIRNYFSKLNVPNGSDLTMDLTVTFGPTFMLPPRLF